MDALVDQHELGSLAYYYQGTGNPANEDAISSIILANSLLTARGVPVAGEMEMSVRHGPVTLLSVVLAVDGQLKLLVAHGESVPGPILEIGNTNSRYHFSMGARNFVEDWNRNGPAHHGAVGVGHIAGKIGKLGRLLDMEVVQVG